MLNQDNFERGFAPILPLGSSLVGSMELSEIVVTRLSPGSIFKLLLIGMCSFQITFSLVLLSMMLLGGGSFDDIYGEPITYLASYTALAFYLLLGLLTAPFWAGIVWLIIWPCMWLYSNVRPIRIRYVPYE